MKSTVVYDNIQHIRLEDKDGEQTDSGRIKKGYILKILSVFKDEYTTRIFCRNK